jgi:hypothetical protein
MSKLLIRSLAALALGAVIITGSAMAQGRGHSAANQGWRGDRDGDSVRGRDWRGDRDRWTFGNDRRPAGWDKGRKTGWGDCDVPPGQAKKTGCNSGVSVFHSTRRHDNYRRDRDRDRNQHRRNRR